MSLQKKSLPLVMLAICAVFGIEWYRSRDAVNFLSDGVILPSTAPGLALIGIVLTSLVELRRGARRGGGAEGETPAAGTGIGSRSGWLYLAWIVACFALIPLVGFMVASSVILVSSMAAAGVGARRLATISVIFLGAFYFLFVWLLKVEFPASLVGG